TSFGRRVEQGHPVPGSGEHGSDAAAHEPAADQRDGVHDGASLVGHGPNHSGAYRSYLTVRPSIAPLGCTPPSGGARRGRLTATLLLATDRAAPSSASSSSALSS